MKALLWKSLWKQKTLELTVSLRKHIARWCSLPEWLLQCWI